MFSSQCIFLYSVSKQFILVCVFLHFVQVCDKKEFFKPITVCRQGQQKNLHQREIRERCQCKLNKRIVTKPCGKYNQFVQ